MLLNLTLNNTVLTVTKKGDQYINSPPPEKVIRELGWNEYPLPRALTAHYTFFMSKLHSRFRGNASVTGLWLNREGVAMTANRVTTNVQVACWILGKCLCTPLDIRRNMFTLLADEADKDAGLGDRFLQEVANLQNTSVKMIKQHYNIRFHNEKPKGTMEQIQQVLRSWRERVGVD